MLPRGAEIQQRGSSGVVSATLAEEESLKEQYCAHVELEIASDRK